MIVRDVLAAHMNYKVGISTKTKRDHDGTLVYVGEDYIEIEKHKSHTLIIIESIESVDIYVNEEETK